jgi:hypothetical protein
MLDDWQRILPPIFIVIFHFLELRQYADSDCDIGLD